MRAFILKVEDFNELLSSIDRDPQYGYNGGNGVILNDEEREAYKKAHRFFNYQIRSWIEKVQK